MSETRNLIHLPLYTEEPALREYATCIWCMWHSHEEVGFTIDGKRYHDSCSHPILTGGGIGEVVCDHEAANATGKCKHYEPTKLTRLLRWTGLGRKAIMVPND